MGFYTILFRNWSVFDRRIGMDPVDFDSQGNMYVDGPSEEPRSVLTPTSPGQSIAVSINHYTYAASSRDPQYAFDDNVRTWWEPAGGDAQPWFVLDLGDRNTNDPNQEFIIDSSRVIFDAAPHRPTGEIHVDGHDRRWFGQQPGAPSPYQYRTEASLDGKNFWTVVDRTANEHAATIEFDEFKSARCRFVRLTITHSPPGEHLAVLEFTVFGKSAP